MKVLYSQIKELIPDLQATAKELGEVLTMTGFMMDSFEQVQYKGQEDFLLGLEVRQNRADCLSVLGVAREAAAYYRLPLNLPEMAAWQAADKKLDLKIEATDHVKRILAVELSDAKNGLSPEWLKDFLALHGMNSINLLVDLSNYVMIYTGYASHLIDVSKTSGALVWRLNKATKDIVTLDNSELKLTGGELTIEDNNNVLALAGMIGCRAAEIEVETTNLVVEMAVYDRFIVKQNSRALSVVTEASNRLSKDMSPAMSELAFRMLVALIIKETGAKPASAVHDYYPKKQTAVNINFNPNDPARFAGIEINQDTALDILENLGCEIEVKEDDLWIVEVPLSRMDLNLAEDLVEEVLRINRYDAIPNDEAPALARTTDITPRAWRLKEQVKDWLVANGYDEILSQPLVAEAANAQANSLTWQPIVTINSVNEEYPALRQSIAIGLLGQIEEYSKKNALPVKIFEIGRIFGRTENEFSELDYLGLMEQSATNALPEMQRIVKSLLGQLGVRNISFELPVIIPGIVNPNAVWSIIADGKIVGLLAKLKPLSKELNTYYAEVDLAAVLSQLNPETAVVELTTKLVSLDANIEAANFAELQKKMSDLSTDNVNLWSLSVVDEYKKGDVSRYTVRAVYDELSDVEAKALHAKIFSLN